MSAATGTVQPVSRVFALFVAAVAGVGVWVTWRVFVATATGQRIEEAAYAGATFGQNRVGELAQPVLEVVSLSFVVLGVAVATVIAVLRRRWALAVQAALLVLGANLATQVLKRLVFYRPEADGEALNTLPSGHTTVAASFAAALLLVAPPWARPVLAIAGAAYAAVTGASTMALQWHRPSDVMAAVLVVLCVASFLCAVGPRFESDREPSVPGESRGGLPGAREGAALVPGICGEPPPVRAHAGAVGTAVAVGGLLVATVLAGLPAAWGLSEAYDAVRSDDVVRQTVTYVAGVAGVVAVSAAAFMLLLLVRNLTARTRAQETRTATGYRPARR